MVSMKIFNLKSTPHKQLSSKDDDPYSLSAVISELLNLDKLFVHHEIIEPGRQISAPHYHSNSEEFFIVLEGTPDLIIDNERLSLKPGDYFAHNPKSNSKKYTIRNDSADVASIIVVRSSSAQDAKY